MIGLDTNVVVRYIVQDDDEQALAASHLIEETCTPESPGLITHIVLCELVWVLHRGYQCDRTTIVSVLRQIFDTRSLHVESRDLARQALQLFEEGAADFADYLISVSNRALAAPVTYSFDRTGAREGIFQLVPS